MSFTFQNAESIKQAIYEELQNILCEHSDVRKTAEERMKQLEFVEGYGVYLAEFIMNQSFELGPRQLACIMLTKYVETHWDKTVDPKIPVPSEQVKKTIRNILPNGLYDQNSKIRTGVADTISSIASCDWPDVWTELFDIIIKCLSGNEDSTHGATQVLSEFTYDEKQIKELGPILIAEIYRIFDADQTYSVRTRRCAIKVLQPLLNCIYYNMSNKPDQAAIINSILQNFTDKFISSLTIGGKSAPNFALKTEIINVLLNFLTQMPKYIYPYMNRILPTIWQLLTQTADMYVKVIVNELEPNPFPSTDEEDDELTNFSTMIIQIFEFIQNMITSSKFRAIIKNVLPDLIYVIIVYIQVPEEQIETWNEDVENFLESDVFGPTVRLVGIDLLTTIEERFMVKALQPLSDALTKQVTVAEAEKYSGNPNWWKIFDASMFAVTKFKNIILANKDKFDLLNYLTLVKSLMNYQSSPYLFGRCLCTISSYAKSQYCDSQMLNEVFDITLVSLAVDKPLNLKIFALRAIYEFLKNLHEASDNRQLLLLSKLDAFVDGIISLAEQSESMLIAQIMETLTLIISFDNNFAATVQSKVTPLTMAVYLRYTNDPFVLEHVQDMLKALSQNPLCLQLLQEKIVPILVNVLNLQNDTSASTMQDTAFSALETIVKYSQAPLCDNLIENAFPATVQCILRSNDNSVIINGGECLRAFIYVSPEQVCSYKNGEGLNYIMQVATMLLNPMNNECTASQIGRLIITIIMKLGNMLGDNIELLLKSMISKLQLVTSLRTVNSLIIPFAYLCLTQMEAVLNFLSTVPGPTGEPAMQFIFSIWLNRQFLFYTNYDRKVTIMALCKLFEYGITAEDSRLMATNINALSGNVECGRTRSQTNKKYNKELIPLLVLIFKTLIKEVDYVIEHNVLDDDSNSWTDDDDNEDDDTAKVDNQTQSEADEVDCDNSDLADSDDDDPLMQNMLKDHIFPKNMPEHLTEFLRNFSSSKHFCAFASQLNEREKNILKSIQIQV